MRANNLTENRDVELEEGPLDTLKTVGSKLRRGLTKLATGGMTPAVADQLSPLAGQLEIILNDPRLKAQFMALVNKAQAQAPQAQPAQPGQPAGEPAAPQTPDEKNLAQMKAARAAAGLDDTAPAQPGQGDTRQTAAPIDQQLGTIVKQMRAYQPNPQAKPLPDKMVQGVEKDMANMRTNKDWAVMTGNKILKFAAAGYNVDALQKKWAQEYAVGAKQKIMQDQFSEELEALRKLAGL